MFPFLVRVLMSLRAVHGRPSQLRQWVRWSTGEGGWRRRVPTWSGSPWGPHWGHHLTNEPVLACVARVLKARTAVADTVNDLTGSHGGTIKCSRGCGWSRWSCKVLQLLWTLVGWGRYQSPTSFFFFFCHSQQRAASSVGRWSLSQYHPLKLWEIS